MRINYLELRIEPYWFTDGRRVLKFKLTTDRGEEFNALHEMPLEDYPSELERIFDRAKRALFAELDKRLIEESTREQTLELHPNEQANTCN